MQRWIVMAKNEGFHFLIIILIFGGGTLLLGEMILPWATEQESPLILTLGCLSFLLIPAVLAIMYAKIVTKNIPSATGDYSKTHSHLTQISSIQSLDKLREMSPVEFERFIARLFRNMGYQVKETATTGDEGIDLLVSKGARTGVVQCKRYRGNVGQPVVRDLYGAMIHNRADEAFLVTTGRVSLPAQQWATGKPIHLVDGTELMEWVRTFDTSG
jgi:HJR/Mrr/RecB family endonuclease